MTRPVLTIDGSQFDSLEGFYDEVERKLIPGAAWGRNLHAFNDILRGGFGTPDGGFVLRWVNSALSRDALAMPATIRFIEEKLLHCHPSNVGHVQADLEAARRGEGETLFELIVQDIRVHGPGGAEEDDGIELELV